MLRGDNYGPAVAGRKAKSVVKMKYVLGNLLDKRGMPKVFMIRIMIAVCNIVHLALRV
ncbi:MAG: hypothetical protein MT490_08750 [Sphingomonas sp.]|uniref:hypothetical protein n=1 Tax=Sphingomonas sp. TaxID=28214 RepID=UPI002273D1C0|nr:hypothetical protein [Sphingomonas sp.]MCX8475869.1 hypothetical protein [Sphingomonas sp.]